MIFASRKLNNQIDEQNFMNMYYSILLKKHGITHHCSLSSLTLPVPCILESCIKIKINLNSYFHISLRCLKRFYEGFEAPKRSMKIKFKLIFCLRPWSGREGLGETFIVDGWALPFWLFTICRRPHFPTIELDYADRFAKVSSTFEDVRVPVA